MKELSMDTHSLHINSQQSVGMLTKHIRHSSNKDHANVPCRLFIHSTNNLTHRTDNLVIVNVEVQHQ